MLDRVRNDKLCKWALTWLTLASLLLAPVAQSVPASISYLGRLTDANGIPLAGPVQIDVNFFASQTGGTPLANQLFTAVPLTDGLFNLAITLTPAQFQTVWSQTEVWIEVSDQTNNVIYPRQKYNTVPYAFQVPVDGTNLTFNANGQLTLSGIKGSALPAGMPTAGQTLSWDGANWVWSSTGGGGGGGGANSVDSAAIQDGSVSNADVAAGAAIAGTKINPDFGSQNITTTGTITGNGSGLSALPAGLITDAHINAAAAIAQSKINGLSTSLAAREPVITAGTTAQFYRGDKSWATLDTSAIPENGVLYFTEGRARAALSGTAPLSYNSSTGDFTITSASGVSAGTISAADYLSFSGKQAAIDASSTVNTGSLTTAQQMAVEIKPYGTNAGESGELRFKELAAGGSDYVGFKAPDAVTGNKIYVLPPADGSAGQFLATDGTGNLSWSSVAGGAGGTVTSVAVGAGLTGGPITGSGTISLANTAVAAGSYTRATITVDAQGRLTAASDGSSINLASDITGILPLADGGTGATTAALARAGLGAASLGANSDITSITGLTTALSISQGGTGGTNSSAARTNLGLGPLAIATEVGSAQITDGSVDTIDLADASITMAKLGTGLASNTSTANSLVKRDSSGNFSANVITANLTGNATSADTINGTLNPTSGGTGLSTLPTSGQILIGNGSGYALNQITSGSGVNVTSAAGSITVSLTPNASFTQLGASEFVRVGGGEMTASPTAGVVRGAKASGSDIAGGDIKLSGGLGTGTGTSGSIKFETHMGGSSGAASGTPISRMIVAPNGNVGIGTNSPTRLLDLSGDQATLLQINRNSAATSKNTIQFSRQNTPLWLIGSSMDDTTNQSFSLYDSVASSTRLFINTSGYVGIGSTTPDSRLTVFDNVTTSMGYVAQFVNNSNTATSNGILIKAGGISTPGAKLIEFKRPDDYYLGSVTQNADTTVNYGSNSDLRLKENIRESQWGLDLLNQIKVHDYNYIADSNKAKQQGFIAQELYEVYPQAVTVGGEDVKTNPWQVDYGKLTPLLVKALQDLKGKVSAIAADVSELLGSLDGVYQRFNAQDIEIVNLRSDTEAELSALKARAEFLETENAEMRAENQGMKDLLCTKFPEAAICVQP